MRGPTRPGTGARSPLTWLSAILLIYLVAPVALFLFRSAGHPSEGFGQTGLLGAFATSVEAATISTTIVAFLGVPLAYVLARRPGWLANVAGMLVQLPLALPPLVSGVALLYLFGPNSALGQLAGGRFTESVTGIVLAQSFVSSPFLVITTRSAFAAIDPNLEDVAATAGIGPLRQFTRVAVPLAGPGIRAGMLLTWLRAFGEYGATVMMAYYPLSLPVFTYVQFSSVGLPATQAPSLLALGLAAAVVATSRAPLPKRARGRVPPALTRGAPMGGSDGAAPWGPPVPVGFDLSVRAGDFRLRLAYQATSHRLAIVGPSGAGKSLTLRALAGLLPGAVNFAGRPVGALPAQRRQVGYVPQGQSLLPDRSAWANVMLGPRADAGLASHWFHALGIEVLAARLPSQMSGGQRQRVALARAFSGHPAVVLLDEPFTGLDTPVRTGLVHELRRRQLETGLSSVLVTHDFREAALLADEVVVISGGRAMQAGRVADVWRRPASPEVARLLGLRNLLPGVAASATSIWARRALISTGPHGLASGTPLTWGVRPEHVSVAPAPSTGALPALVNDAVDLGPRYLLTVAVDGGPCLEAEVPGQPGRSAGLAPGTRCWAMFPAEAVLVWPDPATNPNAAAVPGPMVD